MAEKTGTQSPGTESGGDQAEDLPMAADPADPADPAEAPEAAEPAEEPTLENLAAKLEQANSEVEALQDQALRAKAEAENTRRRAGRDVENAHKFALERFAGDLLPVLDSLEKTVESAPADGAESARALVEGAKLSVKLFTDVLHKFGIEQIDPLGEPFDPQKHEAMAMVANPDAEPNSVMEVMQKGYVLNGRLVRAAMVIVSKGAD